MRPPAVKDGALHAFFVYDVADTIDLARLQRVAGEGVRRAPLSLPQKTSPASLQFPIPPLVVGLPAAKVAGHSASVRAKMFDYGVVSVRLTLPYAGAWSGFEQLAHELRSSPAVAEAARRSLEGIGADLAPVVAKPRDQYLVEDYFVFEVGAFEGEMSASTLLAEHASALAELIAGEQRPLEAEERAETLRTRFSYYDDDLVVVQWDGAFLYDREDGATATLDILEFANTQLVELRTYDGLLDAELDAIYGGETRRTFGPFGRNRAVASADRLRVLIVDVLELTDRSSNALKITGDAYYARLYRAAATRFGLKDWQRQLDSKMSSVNEIYRFFADRAQNSRAEFLELTVVVLIAVEIVIGLLALRH